MYDQARLEAMGVNVIARPLLDEREVLRHDGQQLAQVIMENLYNNKSFRRRRGVTRNIFDQIQWQLGRENNEEEGV